MDGRDGETVKLVDQQRDPSSVARHYKYVGELAYLIRVAHPLLTTVPKGYLGKWVNVCAGVSCIISQVTFCFSPATKG